MLHRNTVWDDMVQHFGAPIDLPRDERVKGHPQELSKYDRLRKELNGRSVLTKYNGRCVALE